MDTIDYFYKKCNCDIDAWEEIVVRNDDNYDNRTVIYFHCDDCGTDFAVLDFETNEVLFFDETYGT